MKRMLLVFSWFIARKDTNNESTVLGARPLKYVESQWLAWLEITFLPSHLLVRTDQDGDKLVTASI